jgi:hypothetical protein
VTALLWDKIQQYTIAMRAWSRAKVGGDDVEGSLRSNNNVLIALYPSDPMELLGPIMVHLREEFGSDNVLKRFCNSPS